MAERSFIIGIAGGSGSGKTTLAKEINGRFSAESSLIIQHDAYYRGNEHMNFAQRCQVNYDHPDALETELMVDHLIKLSSGKEVEIPVYDFSTHSRQKAGRKIFPRPLIVVEGILLFAEPDLNRLFDLKIFVRADEDVRFIRRLERDVTERGRSMASVKSQYLETVKPMFREFVEPSMEAADIIVSDAKNPVALDLICSYVKQRVFENKR